MMLIQVLKEAPCDKRNVHEIVLVGGSTRIPLVQKKVQDFFKKDPNKT